MALGSRLPSAALAAFATALALAPVAAAQKPDPTTLTRTAIARLVTDTRALTENDANESTRAAALAAATRIDASALPNPCRAIRLIAAYRRVLPGVNGNTSPGPGGAPGPPSVRGKLDR